MYKGYGITMSRFFGRFGPFVSPSADLLLGVTRAFARVGVLDLVLIDDDRRVKQLRFLRLVRKESNRCHK